MHVQMILSQVNPENTKRNFNRRGQSQFRFGRGYLVLPLATNKSQFQWRLNANLPETLRKMHTFEFLLFLLSVKVKKRTINYSYVLSIIVTEHESTILPIISVTMIKTIWSFICHRSRQKYSEMKTDIQSKKK